MATYPYTGRLTDFGEAPFPSASPSIWVEASEDAFGPLGLLASRKIPVSLNSNGEFLVFLTPSVETSPPVTYTVRCDWLDAEGRGVGWASWTFVAAPGGGEMSGMVDTPLSVWYVGPPWPPETPPGFYLDRFTNDVGRKH